MNKFSKRSLANLETCHPDLIRLAYAVLEEIDFAVIKGHRGKKEQDAAFDNGFSQLIYPHSYHNKTPSLAMDLAPTPIDWKDIDRFEALGEIVLRKAKELGLRVTWGKVFKSYDLPHFQLEIDNAS